MCVVPPAPADANAIGLSARFAGGYEGRHGVLRGVCRIDDQDCRARDDQRDRHKVLVRVVGQCRIKQCVHDDGGHAGEEGDRAIRGAACHHFGGDDGVAAGLVLDDDRMAEFLGQRLLQSPRHDIDRSARRERDHDLGRLALACAAAEKPVPPANPNADERGHCRYRLQTHVHLPNGPVTSARHGL